MKKQNTVPPKRKAQATDYPQHQSLVKEEQLNSDLQPKQHVEILFPLSTTKRLNEQLIHVESHMRRQK